MLDTIRTQIEKLLREELRDDDSLAISLHNELNNDDYIYDMAEIDDILSNSSPSQILNLSYYGDFRPTDDYFIFNGYANLESSCYADSFIDYDELIENAIDNEDFSQFSCEYEINELIESAEELEEIISNKSILNDDATINYAKLFLDAMISYNANNGCDESNFIPNAYILIGLDIDSFVGKSIIELHAEEQEKAIKCFNLINGTNVCL